MSETKKRIRDLKNSGFFDSWQKQEYDLITFFIYPRLDLPENWIEQRIAIYKRNAKKLRVDPPRISFHVYPSLKEGKTLGIIPAVTFIKSREIHGHVHQSLGHELTHILLGELNPSEHLPANGLWGEGICVYLDGTHTDRRKHVLSLNFGNEILATPWIEWRDHMPGDLYPIAGSAVQYCESVFGWDAVLDFLKGQKNLGSHEEEASQDAFHVSYAELQNGWRKWLGDY